MTDHGQGSDRSLGLDAQVLGPQPQTVGGVDGQSLDIGEGIVHQIETATFPLSTGSNNGPQPRYLEAVSHDVTSADDNEIRALTEDEEAVAKDQVASDNLKKVDQSDVKVEADEEAAPSSGRAVAPAKRSSRSGEGLPIKMLHDRILVQLEGADGDRKSSGGILIPATAQVGKRLTWAEIVATGPSVRSMELGDRVLFNPEDRYEVEVGGNDYIILRERDIHAVAAERLDDSPMGLYL